MENIYVFIASIIFTHFLIKKTLPYFKKQFLDIPNERSSHNLPTPTGGGITFVSVSFVLSLFKDFYLPLLALPLAAVGFIDDKYGIRKRYRLLIQISTVISIIYLYLIKPNILEIHIYSILNIFFFLFLLLLGVSTINFLNFMDGIDGLLISSFSVLLILSIFINKNYAVLPLLGSTLVFSFWNWNPAKIFMGDCGSTFLGAILIGIIFSSNSILGALKILIASFPLMADACITVLRRFYNKENIFSPHKKQLFQRLVIGGFSQYKVSLIYLASTIILSIAALISLYVQIFLFLIIFCVGLYLEKYKAINFDAA